MTRTDFTVIMLYLEAAVARPVPVATLEVYYDLLGDLPADVLQAAVTRAAMDHRFASLPLPGELRELADEIMHPGQLSAAEAWNLASTAALRIGWPMLALCIQGKSTPSRITKEFAKLPKDVIKAIQFFGVSEFCGARTDFMRSQWLKIYETIARREQRQRMLPPGLRTVLANLGDNWALPAGPGRPALTYEKDNGQSQ